MQHVPDFRGKPFISRNEFFKGFHEFAQKSPRDLWRLLKHFGFDLQLQRNHCRTMEENLQLLEPFEKAVSLQFHEAVQDFIQEWLERSGQSNPLVFKASQLVIDKVTLKNHPI